MDSEFGAPTNASLLSECPDCTCPSLRGHGRREAASSRQPARMSLPLPTPELAGATSGEGRAPCSRDGPCASRGRRRGGRHPGTAVPWWRQTREVTALDQQDGEPGSGLCCLGRRIRSFVSEQSSQSTSGGGAGPCWGCALRSGKRVPVTRRCPRPCAHPAPGGIPGRLTVRGARCRRHEQAGLAFRGEEGCSVTHASPY